MQQWYQCPRCGTPVSYGAQFCNNCGQPLNWQQPQPQPPPQQPAQTPYYQQQYQQQGDSIKLKTSLEIGTDDTVQRLLKEASQKKKNGDLDGAIALLKAAYKELDRHSWSFPIEVYLRLPLYLQESGKKDEAWKEFNRLILWVSSKPRYSPEVAPMELSAIWDKMRLFLQREGKNDHAVQFAVWSYLSWAVGLYVQKREGELKAYKAKTNIQKTLKTSLHKAGKEFLTDRLVKIILDSLNNLPVVNYEEIAKIVQEEMKVQ